MKTRRILVASYHFPPTDAVGGLRVAKFTRLLREHGWEPVVLTVRDDLRENGLDPQRLKGLERIPIYRTPELPRLFEAAVRMTAPLRRPQDTIATSPSTGAHLETGGQTVAKMETIAQRLKRYAAALLLNLPDPSKNWSAYATVSAIRLIRRHDIDWIFTSGPPFSSHMIGLAAKSLTGTRWIADFRDPWIDLLDERDADIRCGLSDHLERAMEAAVVRRADRIVTTTERMRTAMLSRYAAVSADRFVAIPNSIDTETLLAAESGAPPAALTITYAGSLYFDRTPEPLFHAIRLLLDSGAAAAGDIRVRLVGNCESIDGARTGEVAARYGLGDIVNILPVVPYADALRMMKQSHLLLVLAPERHRLVVPAKVYDYLGSGTRILGIAAPGATADLIAQTGAGDWFVDSDRAGIAGHLAAMLQARGNAPVRNDPAAFSNFDARRLTAKLAAEMDAVDAQSNLQPTSESCR